MSEVPARYVGLWRRKGIWRSNGSSDLTTQVWWFQSPRFHIDLRVPVDRPRLGSAEELARLAPQQHARFAAQIGFAGLTVVEGERCEWRPEIAFPALSGETDAGAMRFDSADQLHETGIDGSYEEDWLREDSAPVIGLRMLQSDAGHDADARADGGAGEVAAPAIAYLLIGANWLAFAAGHAIDRLPACGERDAALWTEISFARHDPAAANWRIVASTHPWREGGILAAAAEFNSSTASTLKVGAEVRLQTANRSRWQITDIAHP